MKNLFCALAASVCLISAGTAAAGDRHYHKGGEWQGRKGAHLLEKELDLSDEQKEQIQSIYERTSEERGVRGNHGLLALNPEAADYHKQVQTLAQERALKLEQDIVARGNAHAEIYAILTPEQQNKLKAMQQKRQERHQKRMEGKKRRCGQLS